MNNIINKINNIIEKTNESNYNSMSVFNLFELNMNSSLIQFKSTNVFMHKIF